MDGAHEQPPDEPASPLTLGQAAASQIAPGEWHLDAPDETLLAAEAAPDEAADPAESPPATLSAPSLLPFPASAPSLAPAPPATDAKPPPSPEQLIEAMLFVGGEPLTPAAACSAIRGLTAAAFQGAVESLARRYRRQGRPYTVAPRDGGFQMELVPAHRNVRERLFGGPREARLSQPMVDVLSVVAYRQPVGKAEVDALRGTDSGPVVRQLVRLGLIAVKQRAEAGGQEVRYGTTPRFLQLFGINSLDELPRLGDTHPVWGNPAQGS